MARFYKAIEGTETFERFGSELILAETVARREFGNRGRREVTSADPEDIAAELRKDENCDNMNLIEELCDMADMLDEWEAEEEDAWDLAYKAADKLGVIIE